MKSRSSDSAGHRLWFPTGVAILAVAGVAWVRLQPELERNAKSWFVAIIVLLAALLGLFWFTVLSRVAWRTRGVGLLVLGLLAVGGRFLVRVEGTVDGKGLPRLVWRWAPVRTGTVVATDRPAAVAGVPATSPIPDVPEFFGPGRRGVLRDANLARDWAVSPPRELWRQPIGLGWSAFSVVAGRAYTQEQRGDDELVTAYDLPTGHLVWAHTNHVRFAQWQGGDGPRATPTVDRGRVFAFGATGILDCLDAQSGRLIWSRDVLGENHLPNLIWGTSCSPLVIEDTVVVTGGAAKGPTVLAYDRRTGAPGWRAGTDKASYSSPAVAVFAGRTVVLSVNAASFTIHDPADGKVLLDYPWANDKWPKAAQPVLVDGDRVFLSAGYGVGCVLLEIKAGAGGSWTATEVWKNKMMKTQFNSAAVRDGFLFGLDDGLLACVDLATGARRWKDGRYGSGQSLLVDDLVLIQSEAGGVVLAGASPTAFRELGRLPALSSKTWNYPTLAGRYLLARNDAEVVCYELPVTPREKPAPER